MIGRHTDREGKICDCVTSDGFGQLLGLSRLQMTDERMSQDAQARSNRQKCRFCVEFFHNQQLRESHENNRHPKEIEGANREMELASRITCPICRKNFESKQALIFHSKVKHPVIKLGKDTLVPLESILTTLCENKIIYYKCPFTSCIKKCRKIEHFADHIAREHKNRTNQMSDCVSIGLFDEERERSHQEPISQLSDSPHRVLCPICKKKFKSEETLMDHAKVKHPVIKLRNGPPIPLEFALKTQSESSRTYYECPFCLHNYLKIDDVMKHILIKHKDRTSNCITLELFDTQSREKTNPYTIRCPICNGKFKSEEALRYHVQIKHPIIELGDGPTVYLGTTLKAQGDDWMTSFKCPFCARASLAYNFPEIESVMDQIINVHKDRANRKRFGSPQESSRRSSDRPGRSSATSGSNTTNKLNGSNDSPFYIPPTPNNQSDQKFKSDEAYSCISGKAGSSRANQVSPHYNCYESTNRDYRTEELLTTGRLEVSEIISDLEWSYKENEPVMYDSWSTDGSEGLLGSEVQELREEKVGLDKSYMYYDSNMNEEALESDRYYKERMYLSSEEVREQLNTSTESVERSPKNSESFRIRRASNVDDIVDEHETENSRSTTEDGEEMFKCLMYLSSEEVRGQLNTSTGSGERSPKNSESSRIRRASNVDDIIDEHETENSRSTTEDGEEMFKCLMYLSSEEVRGQLNTSTESVERSPKNSESSRFRRASNVDDIIDEHETENSRSTTEDGEEMFKCLMYLSSEEVRGQLNASTGSGERSPKNSESSRIRRASNVDDIIDEHETENSRSTTEDGKEMFRCLTCGGIYMSHTALEIHVKINHTNEYITSRERLTKYDLMCHGGKTEADKEDLIEVVSQSNTSNESIKILQDIQITGSSTSGVANTEISVMENLEEEFAENENITAQVNNTQNEEIEIPYEIGNGIEVIVASNDDIVYIHSDTEEQDSGETGTENKDKPIYISDTDDTTEAQGPNKMRKTRWMPIEGANSEVTASSGTNVGSVKCEICILTFSTENSMRRHMKVMHAQYKCVHCQFMFFDEPSLKAHFVKKHKDLGTCALCKAKFNSEEYLLRHYRTVHSEVIDESKIWKCQKCNTSITNEKGLHEHLSTTHAITGSFCPICRKGFLETDEVMDHLKASHVVVITKPSCSVCKLVCANEAHLMLHYQNMHVNKGKGQCISEDPSEEGIESTQITTESVKTASLKAVEKIQAKYVAEMKPSRKNKKFECYICLMKFKRDLALADHLKERHAVQVLPKEKAQKWFVCPKCEDKFETKEMALEHVRRGHVENYKCEKCLAYFQYQKHLKKHEESSCKFFYHDMIIEKFCCRYCGFMSQDGLRSHMMQCKMYQGTLRCKYCMDSFDNEELLDSHMNIRHQRQIENVQRFFAKKAARIFPCPICKDKFSSEVAVINHSEAKHPAIKIDHSPPVPLESILETDYKKDMTYHKCPFCPQFLKAVSYVMHHIKRRHPNHAHKLSDCVSLGLYKDSPQELSRGPETSTSNSEVSKDQVVFNESSGTSERTEQRSFMTVKSLAVPCPICKKDYESKEALLEHARLDHPAVQLGSCPPVPLESLLVTEFKNDRRHFICPFCTDLHQTLSDVVTHIMKNHVNQACHMSDCVTLKLYEKKLERSPNEFSRTIPKKQIVDTESSSYIDAKTCPICDRPCSSKQALIDHSKIKHPAIKLGSGPPVPLESVVASKYENGSTSYTCPFCKLYYSTLPNLAEHIGKHKDKAHLISDCVTLGLYDKNSKDSRHELSSRSGVKQTASISDAILCPICERPCTSKAALINHSRVKHPAIKLGNGPPLPLESVVLTIYENGLPTYVCPFCNMCCYSLPNLVIHIETHKDKTHLMSDCVSLGLFDKDSENLLDDPTNQVSDVSVEAPRAIVCSICKNMFKSELDLQRHAMYRHPAIRLGSGPPVPLESALRIQFKDSKTHYECPFCTHTYPKVSAVVEHIFKEHKDCENLMSDSVSLGLFEKDSRSLALPSAIACPMCKYIFKSEWDLKQHAELKHPAIRLGNGLPVSLESALKTKPKGGKMHYECPFCTYSHPIIGSIVKHINTDHEGCANQLSDCLSLGLYGEGQEKIDLARPISCPICHGIFQSEDAVEQHAKASHPAIKLGDGTIVPLETALRTKLEGKEIHYVCPFCPLSYATIRSVTFHIFGGHKDRVDRMFDCVSLGLFHRQSEESSMREFEIDRMSKTDESLRLPVQSSMPFYIPPDAGRQNDTIFRSDRPSYNSYESGHSRANKSPVFDVHEESITRNSGRLGYGSRNRDYNAEEVLTTRRIEVTESRLKRSHRDDEPQSYDFRNKKARSEELVMSGRDIEEYMRYHRDARGEDILRSRRPDLIEHEFETDRGYMEEYRNDERSSSSDEIRTQVYMPTASRKRSVNYRETSRMERDPNPGRASDGYGNRTFRSTEQDKRLECSICRCAYMSRAALDMHVRINHMDKYIMSDESANRDRDQRRFARKDRHRYSRSNNANQNDQVKLFSQNQGKQGIVRDTKEGKGSASDGNPETLTSSGKTRETSDKIKELEKRTLNEKETSKVPESSGPGREEHEESSDASEEPDVETIKRITEKYDVQIMPADPNKQFECRVCLKSLNKDHALAAHLMGSHKMPVLTGEEEEWHQCPYCSKRFQTSEMALEHVRKEHNTPFRCKTCKAYFENESQLRNHETSNCELFFHLPIKMEYSCRYCKLSMCKKDLPNHMVQCEFTTRPFRCKYCMDSFENVELLKLHVETKHAKGEVSKALEVKTKQVKSYPCPICLRNFISEVAVKNHSSVKHALIKLGNNPPVSLDSALFHYKSKKGKTHYKCIFCPQSFAKRNPTIKHLKRMHTDKAFEITDGVTLAEKSGSLESITGTSASKRGPNESAGHLKSGTINQGLDTGEERFESHSDEMSRSQEASTLRRPGVSQRYEDNEPILHGSHGSRNKNSWGKEASRQGKPHVEDQRFGHDSYSARQRYLGSEEVMSRRHFRSEERFRSDGNRNGNRGISSDYKANYPYGSSYEDFSSKGVTRPYRNQEPVKHVGYDSYDARAGTSRDRGNNQFNFAAASRPGISRNPRSTSQDISACTVCGANFMSYTALNMHIEVNHPGNRRRF